jgi:hypothetical protein
MRILEEGTKQDSHPVLPELEPPVMPPLGPEMKPAAKPGTAVNPPAVSPLTPAP